MNEETGQQDLGMRAIKATISETNEAGVVVALLVVAGPYSKHYMDLARKVGSDIVITTASAERRWHAMMTAAEITEKKELRTIRFKLAGGKNLDELVGLQVVLEAAQRELAV